MRIFLNSKDNRTVLLNPDPFDLPADSKTAIYIFKALLQQNKSFLLLFDARHLSFPTPPTSPFTRNKLRTNKNLNGIFICFFFPLNIDSSSTTIFPPNFFLIKNTFFFLPFQTCFEIHLTFSRSI